MREAATNLQFPFYKFAFRFDTERLLSEVGAIPETAWRFHHENFKGNSALHLISTNGTVNDEFEPPMRPTEYLERCPYIMQIMAQFKTLLGRARLWFCWASIIRETASEGVRLVSNQGEILAGVMSSSAAPKISIAQMAWTQVVPLFAGAQMKISPACDGMSSSAWGL